MTAIVEWIKAVFSPGRRTIDSPEELQDAFKARYRSFRALLTANNNALDAMADLELALQSGQTFSMAFVRARTTAIMVNVYKMVQHLEEMSDGRYHRLKKVHEKIGFHVNAILEEVPPVQNGEWVVALTAINRNTVDLVGNKMANLGEIATISGMEIPQGFAITVSASAHFLSTTNLDSEILRLLQTLDSDNLAEVHKVSVAIQQLISRSSLPVDLEEKMYSAYAELEKETQQGVTVALRSSALGEDSAGASFAGQYHTELDVPGELLGQAYKEIVASKFTSRAMLYRMKRGYRHKDVAMCVGCLAMVDAVVSGVTYSRDPENPESLWVVINVVRGAAVKVVDGTCNTCLLLVSRRAPYRILQCNTAKRTNGSDTQPPPSDILTMKQIKRITKIALILEDHFGSPQDIEWSINRQGKIIVLQSRPMVAIVGGEPSSKTEGKPEIDDHQHPLLRGSVTASIGVAWGPVFLVRSPLDMLEFPKGAVLVVEHPLPEWAPLLTKATAVIGETGSVAGHLATVCREFTIPAVFGVEDALKRLTNGEVITVDASNKRIYSGKREDFMVQVMQQPDLMAGSPVQALLRNLLKHITPLNLTDPASPFFKPGYCETLHDITRFCHEKSVIEMFKFGEKEHFGQRISMRLVEDVPLDWWVVNVADGFREDVDLTNKTIHIDDIVSTPMIAIWQGITAFPWCGPPALCVKGLGSILFQSTMQPGLDPAVGSALTGKNYFLISRHFCNLSIRLGYHFAMIEACLSDLRIESYVTFSFKGGAADAKRKAGRIALIAEILNQFDFRIDQKGDALTARVEKRSIDFLEQRLKILGYLSVHTRQIDMVMNTQASVDLYKKKFLIEIKEMLSQPEAAN
jgi:pyruvate,water dikinase